jgi:type I restriction enzyme, S subunit
VLPEFVAKALETGFVLNQIEKFKGGVAQQNLSLAQMKEFTIPLPPIKEQQRIVGILDKAFAAIAAAKANAEKNLQNARSLFERHLQSVFTKSPNGWADTALGDICAFVRGPFGGSLKKSTFVADGYAVYEQQHAIYDQFHDVRYFIDEAKFKEMKRFELLPNDLIMSCSGTMGRVAIVPKNVKRGIINQALLKLTPTAKILNTFLKAWMQSEAFQDALKEHSGGAAIQNVASAKVLKGIRVPLPSVNEQKRVVDELDAVRDETQRLVSIYDRKLAALEELKKALLHEAFTGAL